MVESESVTRRKTDVMFHGSANQRKKYLQSDPMVEDKLIYTTSIWMYCQRLILIVYMPGTTHQVIGDLTN